MFITKAYLNELLSEPVKVSNWFKYGVIPKMKGFDIRQKSNKNKSHVAFRSEELSGHIDFWDDGAVEVYVMDYDSGDELIDVLLDADEEKKQKSAFRKLLKLLLVVK